MTLEDLKNMTPEQLKALAPASKCAKCGVDLVDGANSTRQTIYKASVCDDCYYDELGKIIEEHPLGLPKGNTK